MLAAAGSRYLEFAERSRAVGEKKTEGPGGFVLIKRIMLIMVT